MISTSLAEVLRCPDCSGDIALNAADALRCHGCGRNFDVEGNILCMLPREITPLPEAYNDPDYQRMSEFFDDSSSYFTDGNRIFSMIHNSAHRTIARWEQEAASDSWTLDIGCGRGYHWPFVQDHTHMIGLDIRLESLRHIADHWPDAILLQADLLALPFKSGTIARATSIYALEHIYFIGDALTETARVLADKARFLVGLPCEGGLAWTLGRKVTSERTMSKRYNVDYRKYIALEHCNTAAGIEKALAPHFTTLERELFPFGFLPFIDLNLTLSLALEKR
jgi:uncharacterized protein YbaR (Trm112 family)